MRYKQFLFAIKAHEKEKNEITTNSLSFLCTFQNTLAWAVQSFQILISSVPCPEEIIISLLQIMILLLSQQPSVTALLWELIYKQLLPFHSQCCPVLVPCNVGMTKSFFFRYTVMLIAVYMKK